MRSRFLFLTWLMIAAVAFAVVAPAVASAQDADTPRRVDAQPSPRTWEWTFPEYIGNIGLAFSHFTDLPETNGTIGVFYKHLTWIDGPFYVGFEVSPFSFGAIYDDDGFAAMHVWSSRAQFLFRFYADTLMPEIYLELGIGPQYTRFTTADDLSAIEENGYDRDDFGRWRLSVRMALGFEFDVVGIEFGFATLQPTMDMTYSVYTPTEPVHTESIGGTVYFAVHFRFDSN